ncbi:hypothetical protein G7092_21240 [Mucilaginibacter sp. HC2]|uniref:hypothetical protein n=1 Tax=Mucilaginibacter inviolabilis TaxID=2714892 RepID=UPI00140D2161|nr:hypothetical protein [Mucilaginibacter inviolabilis]NHA06348.1 hypothetical protein [Mucilaginibacter inviolabilis]
MIKLKYLPLVFALFLLACKKEQLLNPNQGKAVSLAIKGYVMADTLEFVLNNKVLGQAIDNKFTLNGTLFNAGDKIQIRKKTDSKTIGNIEVAASPFNQVKRIFYDGTTLSNNLELTPVSKPENMGFRLTFSTPFKGFYGGPVDVELFDQYINFDTFEFIYTPVKTFKNITGAFGDFIELPPAEQDHSYVFKVYKAGTKELPYTSMQNVNLSDPENNYGALDFSPGESKLLSISPNGNDGRTEIGDGYSVIDFSADFK